jgi:hypothetical protein
VRVKTSVTLPAERLKSIDRAESNRSAFTERAARDVALINANADRLNAEAMDVLDYQDRLETCKKSKRTRVWKADSAR